MITASEKLLAGGGGQNTSQMSSLAFVSMFVVTNVFFVRSLAFNAVPIRRPLPPDRYRDGLLTETQDYFG